MGNNVKQIAHIKDLTPDPKNARRHNPRNIGMIENSLNEVGAARSIVVDEDGVILAGNGLIEAAAQAGIERVRVVEADGNEIIAVRRTGLTPEQKTMLALYDNRTTELSDWSPAVLVELGETVDLSGLFHPDEMAAVLEQAGSDILESASTDTIPEQWMVLIECKSEQEQAALLERLNSEGYQCRALMS